MNLLRILVAGIFLFGIPDESAPAQISNRTPSVADTLQTVKVGADSSAREVNFKRKIQQSPDGVR